MHQNLVHTVQSRMSGGEVEVPLLPVVVSEVMSLVDDPDADVRRLAALIHRDPSLAAHVLRVANSPAFSARGGVISLQQAVSRLGMRLLGEIAVSAVLARSVFNDQAGCPQMQVLRKESLANAVWAREVARARRMSVDSAFLCGLLRRIGAPVVLAETVRVARAEEIDLDDATLNRVVEDVEVDVGLRVADLWRLPSPVRACIRFKRSPLAATEHRDAVISVALAAALVPYTWDPTLVGEVRQNPTLEVLNLYDDDVEDLLARRSVVLQTINSMSA